MDTPEITAAPHDSLADEALIRRRLENFSEAIEVLMPKVREGDMAALRLLLRTSEMELRLLKFRAQLRAAAERSTPAAEPKTRLEKESPRTESPKGPRQEPPRERAALPDKPSTHPDGPAVAPEKPTAAADPRGPSAAVEARGHVPTGGDARSGPKTGPGAAHL